MAGHQRPLGLQWGAASCSPSDDSEVVVGSLGDGLGSVNLRTGELVASWRGAAAAPADAAVVSVAALGGGAVACGRRDGSLAVCAVDGATGAIAEGAAASTATPGKALHVCAWVGAGERWLAVVFQREGRGGAKGGGVEVRRRRLPWDESGAWEGVDDRPPHGSERGAGLCALASGAVLVFAGRYHLRAYAREPAASGKRKRAAFAHAECQENPIDVLAACGATDVATGHRDGSIRVWRGVAAAAGAGGALSAYGVYHWHASAVGALDCGDRGDVLLSGGSEAVLVVWQLRRDETEDRSRDFLPRLGGDVIALRACRSPAVLGGADLCLVVTRDRAAHLVALGGSLRRLWTRRSVETAPDAGLFDLGPLGVACNGKDGALQVIDEASDGVARTLDVVPHNRTSSAAAAAVRRPRVVLAAASRDGRHVATVDEWRPRAATGGQELKFWEADGRGGFAAAAVVRGPHGAGVSVGAVGFHPRLVCCATAAPDGLRVWVELDGAAGRWTCALTVAHCAGHGPPRQLCWSPDGSAVACHHDGVLAAWDPASGALLAPLGAPDAAATALAAGFLTAADGEVCLASVDATQVACDVLSVAGADDAAADDAAADDAARGWRYSAKAKAAAVSGDRVVVAVPLEPPAAAVLVFAADDAAPLFAWDVVAVPRALALSGAGGVLAAFPDGALLHLATEAPAAAPTVAVAPRRAGGVEVVEAGDGPSSPSAALAFDALLRVDPARGADLDAPDTASGVCELLLAGAYY